MGSYVGRVALLDEQHRELGSVVATLASVGDDGERWFGNVQSDLAGLVHSGDVLTVVLPSGLQGRAGVTIDLTGPEPVIRLRGVGRAPI